MRASVVARVCEIRSPAGNRCRGSNGCPVGKGVHQTDTPSPRHDGFGYSLLSTRYMRARDQWFCGVPQDPPADPSLIHRKREKRNVKCCELT